MGSSSDPPEDQIELGNIHVPNCDNRGRRAYDVLMPLDASDDASEHTGATYIEREHDDIASTTGSGLGSRVKEDSDREERRPPLPPRPRQILLQSEAPITLQSANAKRPSLLQAKPTIAVSSVDIQTLSFPDGTRGTFQTPASRSVSESIIGLPSGSNTPSRKVSRSGSDADDNASLISYAQTFRGNGDLASLLDDNLDARSPAWKLLNNQNEAVNPFENTEFDDLSLHNFEHEFDEVEAVDTERGNEGQSLQPVPRLDLTRHHRGTSRPMEVKAETLYHSVLCRKANI